MTIAPIYGPFQKVAGTYLDKTSLYVGALKLELRGPNMFHHDNIPVQKAWSRKTWFAKVTVLELKRPAQSHDLNFITQNIITQSASQAFSPNIRT